MQGISESDIQREVQALKSHRRISVNRPILDPDLPEMAASRGGGRDVLVPDDGASMSSSSSSSSGFLGSGTPPKPSWGGVSLNDDGPLNRQDSNGPATGSLRSARSTFTARRRAQQNAGADEDSMPLQRPISTASSSPSSSARASSAAPLDPSHLFWVPASMHPEISPSDFRNFLHEHASRAVRESNERQHNSDAISPPTSPTSPNAPSGSAVDLLRNRSTSIARRGSTLRRQYRPENDSADEEGTSPSFAMRRPSQRAVGYGAPAPELSIDDLQRLEKLAEEASQSSDPSELRSVLRRTMSLSVTPSALDQVDALPQESEQDAPLVPRPGQILRRAARTKIRKSSMSGAEAGGSTSSSSSRFGPRRRGTSGMMTGSSDRPESGELGSQDVDVASPTTIDDDTHSPAESQPETIVGLPQPAPTRSAKRGQDRPGSDGAAESVVDAYSRHSLASDETHRTSVTSVGDTSSKHTSLQDDQQAPSGDLQSKAPAYGRGPLAEAKAADTGSGALQARNQGRLAEQGVPSRDPREEAPAGVRGPIRPVVVQHLPPVPSFEKTRPAPPPPVLQQPAPPSASTSKPASAGAGTVTPPVDAPVDEPIQNAPHPSQILTKSGTMPNLGTSPTVGAAPGAAPARAGKEKKAGFGLHWLSNWSKDDDSDGKPSKKEKKIKKEKDRQANAQAQHAAAEKGPEEKEKDSTSFLGSLFGKKKGSDESKNEHGSHIYPPGFPGSHVTAGSLLDMRNKGLTGYYQRYPIHIERAVYRLSHIKLANPRRPLYEQVLISNLMFWYLSVINKTQQPQQQTSAQQQQQAQPPQEAAPAATVVESGLPGAVQAGATGPATEQLQPMPMAAPEPPGAGEMEDDVEESVTPRGAPAALSEPAPPPDELGAPPGDGGGMVSAFTSTLSKGGGRDKASAQTSSAKAAHGKPKRGGLVKPNRAPAGARSAERAIPGATYGAQHRMLNSELAASHTTSSSNSASLGDGYIKSLGLNITSDKRSANGSASGNARGARSAANDEYAWLGSQSRRATNAEDRRSDPLSEVSAGRRDGAHADDSDGFYRRDYNAAFDGEGDNKWSQRASAGAEMPGQQWRGSNGDAGDAERYVLSQDAEAGSASIDVPSAMLDAARLSQSRRR